MKKNYFNEFSSFLYRIRKNRGYTMMDVSKETGLSTGYISDLENKLEERIGIPRKNNLIKLASFYNFSEEEENEYIRILINLLFDNFFTEEQIKFIREQYKIFK